MSLVPDASVLIVLDQLGHLEPLLGSNLTVLVPESVLNEVDSPRVRKLAVEGRLRIVTSDPSLIPVEFRPRLGNGETGVLAYCIAHKDEWAMIDDLNGRRIAARLRLKFAGTARLLHHMAHRGLIAVDNLSNVFDHLRDVGFWIDDNTVNRILAEQPLDFD